jgi:predicted nucleotidyltransferase
MLKVPASEFQRNIGKYQDLALTQPIAVTRNGRVKTILISADRYAALAGPPSKEEIAKRLAPHIERLKKEGVGALYLFGSVARGEAGPDSDIDFFIDQTVIIKEIIETIDYLDQALDDHDFKSFTDN